MNKKRTTIWLSQDVMDRLDEMTKTDDSKSRSEFIERAIKFYDGYVPLEKIRMDTFTSYEGVSAYHILKAAEKYGFDGFVKKSNNKNLSNILGGLK